MPRPRKATTETMTDDWGEIERNVPGPRGRADIFTPVVRRICDEAEPAWGRILAANKFRARRLAKLLRDTGSLQAQSKRVDGRYYVYFRLQPRENGSRP